MKVKDFSYISCVDKKNFNEIEDGLNGYINEFDKKYMDLYDTEEIQNYINELLNI